MFDAHIIILNSCAMEQYGIKRASFMTIDVIEFEQP